MLLSNTCTSAQIMLAQALYEACSALRKQQDEEVDLMHKLVAQRQQLSHAEQKYQRNMGRFREVRNTNRLGMQVSQKVSARPMRLLGFAAAPHFFC